MIGEAFYILGVIGSMAAILGGGWIVIVAIGRAWDWIYINGWLPD